MMIPYQQIHETLRFLIHIRENDLAVSLAEKIYNLDPSSILSKETYSKTLLFARKRLDQAEKIAAELSLNDPDNLELLYHWSQCLHRNYKTKKALTIIEKVLTLNPHHFEARLERSLFHFFSGNYDTVLEELEKLHNERPEDERIINTLGWFLIHHGDFLNGIRLYRRGRKIGNWGEPRYEHLSGIELPSVLTEKKVLWLGEAGQGDQMINARFIPLFADRGAQVDIFCHPQLKDIFSRIRGIQKIFLNQNQMNFSDYDYVIPAMDSPLALCLDESNLDQGSYFVPTKEKIIEWKNLLGKKNKFRIGLRWQGNIECEPDMQRTIPIEDLLNLLNHSQFSEVEFYSFQTDQSVDTINTHLNIKEIKKNLLTWDDTLAAINQMDLIISSCTSTAHLAAASGTKTWVLVPAACYYIWAHQGNRSPWYSNVTLFRQTEVGQWQIPFLNIQNELLKLLIQENITSNLAQ